MIRVFYFYCMLQKEHRKKKKEMNTPIIIDTKTETGYQIGYSKMKYTRPIEYCLMITNLSVLFNDGIASNIVGFYSLEEVRVIAEFLSSLSSDILAKIWEGNIVNGLGRLDREKIR